MNLFNRYEQLKEQGKLFTSGSVWKDDLGEVTIISSNEDKDVVKVRINIEYPNNYIPLEYNFTSNFFKEKFTRVS